MTKTKTVIGVLAGIAGVVGLAGPASAGTPSTPNQQFILGIQGGAESIDTCSVVATGVIQATGTCTITDINETVTRVRLVFPDGTLTLRVREVAGTDDFDPQTCSDRFTFRDRFRIVNATGAYAGATGNGTDTGSGIFSSPVTPKGCDVENGTLLIGVTAAGNVNLGGSGSA